jgi:phenylacetate-CoA ligase
MLNHKEPPIKNLKAVFTSAETLLPYQREVIMQAFQVPVADQYGCTEMAVFISQCDHGSYHVNSDYSLLEVLNENGEPSSPGEWGEAICTVFVNKTMPLIRYRVGDLLRAPEPSFCPCGLPFPVTKEIIGRKDETIQTPDGRRIGRLDPVFKGLENIIETQLVQTGVNVLLVRLVPSTNYSASDKHKLLQALKVRIGNDMIIQFELLNEIPRDANGKFRFIISKINE